MCACAVLQFKRPQQPKRPQSLSPTAPKPKCPAHCQPTAPRVRSVAQKKFLDLSGSAENQGDLKSVVLHKLSMSAQHSTFPIALGIRITGVDDACFSQTGESYSTITLPNANTHTSRTLQEDNTDLAYEEICFRIKPICPTQTTTHTQYSPFSLFVLAVRSQVPGECYSAEP